MTMSFMLSLPCDCTSSGVSSNATVLVCKQRHCFHMPNRASFLQRFAYRPTWCSSTRFGVRSHTGKPRCEAALAALAENPQNVPDPKVLPKKGMSAIEAVEAQLNALQHNDDPWGNHGIQTMYEFGETIGGLDRCYYFGYGKDLYHFDHFMGNFQNAYPELVNLKSYTIKGSKHEEGVRKVLVEVTGQNQRGPNSQFVFVLAEKDIGAKIGALMTRCLIRHEQA